MSKCQLCGCTKNSFLSLLSDLQITWVCIIFYQFLKWNHFLSSGKHICWDLRFRLPVTQVSHPSAAGVRRMAIHPLKTSSIISSVNGNNEVNIWDLETSSCSTSLWASSVPVMSSRQVGDLICNIFQFACPLFAAWQICVCLMVQHQFLQS